MRSARRFRVIGGLGRRLLRLLYRFGLQGSALDPLRPWTRYRSAPPLPTTSFRDIWKRDLASTPAGRKKAYGRS
jgi:hypothetical protein